MDVSYDVHIGTLRLANEVSGIESLRLEAEAALPLYPKYRDWLSDRCLRRFLVARNGDVDRALQMLETTLAWREQRRPSEVRAADMERESLTGKIYNPGFDRWGRPLLVFDDAVQNSRDTDMHMVFLGWSLELALRQMPPHVDKYVIFINMTKFSVMNQPPMHVVRETSNMLTTCFCECLGHLVVYQAPRAGLLLYNAIKSFIDPKTSSKLVFISGDCADGSRNDETLRHIIGANWRELTGAGQPVLQPKSTPGFLHEPYWRTVLVRERALLAMETREARESRPTPEVAQDALGQPLSSACLPLYPWIGCGAQPDPTLRRSLTDEACEALLRAHRGGEDITDFYPGRFRYEEAGGKAAGDPSRSLASELDRAAVKGGASGAPPTQKALQIAPQAHARRVEAPPSTSFRTAGAADAGMARHRPVVSVREPKARGRGPKFRAAVVVLAFLAYTLMRLLLEDPETGIERDGSAPPEASVNGSARGLVKELSDMYQESRGDVESSVAVGVTVLLFLALPC